MASPRTSKKISKVRFFLIALTSVGLILSGSALVFAAVVNQGYGQKAPSPPPVSLETGEQAEENVQKPVKIYIPRLKRTLDVTDGYFADGRWVISSTGVSYLITSGQVGKTGNAVLYGHNTNGVLGGLWRVQSGDFVEVTAESGQVYKYEIFERHEVKPNQVEILNQTDDARLTVFTCSGFLDSARFVTVGKLVSSI